MEEIAIHEIATENRDMALVKRGKKQLIAVIVVVLVSEIISSAYRAAMIGPSGEAAYELAQGTFRLVLDSLLFYFMYRGHRWARIVMVVLFCLGIVVVCFYIFVPGVPIWFLAFSIVYIVPIALLLGNPIKVFQQYQRDNRLKGGV